MKKYFLIKIDISSKQKYIFQSNVLKEIIGASEIIKFITEDLTKYIFDLMNKDNNTPGKLKDKNFYEGSSIDNGNKLIEAGGNAIYIFNDIDDAKKFNGLFSKFVMKYFDGLELLSIIKKFDIDNDHIKSVLDEMEKELTYKKGKRQNVFKRIGYGITDLCPRTRKPAGYKSIYENKYISKESFDKELFYTAINNKNKFQQVCENTKYLNISEEYIEAISKVSSDSMFAVSNEFKFTTELDKLAGKINEKTYIGITCIDGNGMGEKINTFNNTLKNNGKSRRERNINWLKEYGKLTEEIKRKYKTAFFEMIEKLIENYDSYCENIGFDKSERIIPIRPIIAAGDDITFVSNGKVAIKATKIFMDNITSQKIKFGEKDFNLTVSGGIAIVRKNYPFSRGIKIANELEKSSKKKLKAMRQAFEDKFKDKKTEKLDASLLDWYVDRGNILENLKWIRNEENLELTAKPYLIKYSEDMNKKYITSNLTEYVKKYLCTDFSIFETTLKSLKQSNSNSNFKKFYRSMNSSEVDAELFILKYNVNDKIVWEEERDIGDLKKVIYDAIDVLDLYEYIDLKHNEKGEEKNV
ncbi:Cas10/Cmr2 second palm domain-containing protein [Clostridium lundense]|uniref:Cas10/Cmr2 second palm domain-containing protein n=1 Tax=Clostridium lundense TaxID=319475 RepID=UPI00054D11CF|nr:hypothetical protein [Clostridium lundense]